VTDIKAILRSVVTADEIADRYKLKGKKVRSAVKKGSLPARKAGKVLLMRRDDARALWGKKGDPKAQQPAGPQHKVLDEVVVLEEAAKEYGLKAKRLRKAAKAGKLSARKAGKHWLIRRADVEPVADR
jgi:excisionase family DNA binding protein